MVVELRIRGLSLGSARAVGSIGGLLVTGYVFCLVVVFVLFFSCVGGFGLRIFLSYVNLMHAHVEP